MTVPKQVYSGVLKMTAASHVVAIPTIDTSKSILDFSLNDNDENPSTFQVQGVITDANTLTFSRVGSTSTITVKWYVREHFSGISMQRGTTTVNPSPANQTITAVDRDKSYVILSHKLGGTAFDGDDFVRAELTTDTNLQLTSFATRADSNIAWQVVEFTDSSTTQRGLVSMASGSSSVAVAITAVNLAKSFPMFTYKLQAAGTVADIGQKMVRVRFTSSSELTFDRDNTGVGLDISWFVIEFADDTKVEAVDLAFASGDLTKSATLAADLQTGNGIVVFGGWYHRTGKTPHSAADNPGPAAIVTEFPALNSVKADREITGSSTTDVTAFVIELAPAAADGNLLVHPGMTGMRG